MRQCDVNLKIIIQSIGNSPDNEHNSAKKPSDYLSHPWFLRKRKKLNF